VPSFLLLTVCPTLGSFFSLITSSCVSGMLFPP
jgi:hypothetical protein